MPPKPPAPTQTQITPTKLLGNVAYVSGAPQQILKLPRDMMYRSLNLRLTGAFSTNQSTTTANLAPGDEWGAIRSIEVIANGGNVLRFVTPEQLIIGNFLASGIIKDVNTLSGNAGAYTFDSTVPLWFCIPGMRDAGMTKFPIDTTLNATLFDDLYLRITYNTDATSINSSTTSTYTTVPNVAVSADQAYFINSMINPAFTLTQLTSRTFSTVPPASSPQGGLDFSIPVGQIYGWFLVNTKVAGSTLDCANAFSYGVIQSGVNQYQNFDAKLERRMNACRVPLTVLDFSKLFNNTKNIFDAWTLFRFPKYGLVSESLSLRGVPQCDFYLQNSNTGNVDTTISQLVLIPTAQVTG